MSLSPTQTPAALIGITINVFLIYCVIFHTPKTVKTYSLIIIIHAISDLTTCIFAIVGNVRVIIFDWGIHLLSDGYCTYFGDWAPGVAYNVVSVGFSYALYLILISFVYRFRILVDSTPTAKHLIALCFLAYVPCFLQVMVLELAMSPNNKIRENIHAKFPDYNLTNYMANGIADIRNPYAILGLGHMILVTTPIYSSILSLRRKIVHKLEETASIMSKTTRTMHAELLKMLVVQAFIPQIEDMTLIFVLLEITDFYSTPFIQKNVLLFAIIVTIVSAAVALYFIKPYKNRVLTILRLKVREGEKPKVISVSAML